MKIVFDSNVWRIVALPDDFQTDPLLTDFRIINQAIVDNKIEAYLSETVFTIEAIRKIERQDFFSSRKPKVEIKEYETTEESINVNFTIKPEKGIDFTDRPILKKYFDEAIKLGFKIASLPRIAGIVNEEIELVRYKLEGAKLKEYLDKVFEVINKIENNGAGITHIKEIGFLYDSTLWFEGLKKVPETEIKRMNKASAEWADGDSVAISIALGCDYFCTRDKAEGAGSKSILSKDNLKWLYRDYGFKTILPEDLAKLI